MKFCIIFIIGFTQFVSCCDSNITGVSNADCPFKLFRRKRANEYTRWHADTETTPEFVVKVLDDDITTKKKIVAVNIQTVTKGIEKIIIGGAMVPKPTPSTTDPDQSNEYYTRFVPPTTVDTLMNGDLYLAPVPGLSDFDIVEKLKPIMPHARHPQRDESPPAGPKFLPKITQVPRQYAPITSLGFSRRRTTYAPLTPPMPLTFSPKTLTVSRTSINDVMIPNRTTSGLVDFRKFLKNKEKDVDDYLRRTTTEINEYPPSRTIKVTTSESTEVDSKADDKNDKDDSSYNIFYYDEFDRINKKTLKPDVDLDESYDDKYRGFDTNAIPHEKDKVIPEESSSKAAVTKTEIIYEEMDYNDINSTTQNNSTTEDEIIPTHIETISKALLKGTHIDKRRPICSMLKLRQLSFNSLRTLPEIVAQMNRWAEESPVAKWVDITDGNLTTMENPIYMMIVDDPSSGQIISAKQTVMIVAGIQGRDHHAVAAAMYVLYQLIERSEAHSDLLSKFRFWVIPVFNPDAYDYAMTFPHRREWTKNLRQNWDVYKGRESSKSCEAYGIRCTTQPCYGVNLDRNFEYQWIPAEELRTEHPCGSLYAGARQLSEPETLALTTFLHRQGTPLYTFIAFKEGDVLGVMYPYSHTRKRRSFDLVFRQRASRAAAAAYSISGRPYVAGQTSEFLPLHAGGIEDWIDGHLGIDNTYTIMMFRPADAYNSKLSTERIVHETYAAMDTLVLQSVEPIAAPPIKMTKTENSAVFWSKSFPTMLILSVGLTCFT